MVSSVSAIDCRFDAMPNAIFSLCLQPRSQPLIACPRTEPFSLNVIFRPNVSKPCLSFDAHFGHVCYCGLCLKVQVQLGTWLKSRCLGALLIDYLIYFSVLGLSTFFSFCLCYVHPIQFLNYIYELSLPI